jgi:hypothetical protein
VGVRRAVTDPAVVSRERKGNMMTSETCRELLKCVDNLRHLTERMSKEDAYGGEWAIRADYSLLDMQEYLEKKEEESNARL